MDSYVGTLQFVQITEGEHAPTVPESRVRAFAYSSEALSTGGSGLCLGNFTGDRGMALRGVYDLFQALVWGGFRHQLISSVWLLPLNRAGVAPHEEYGRFAHLVPNTAAGFIWIIVLNDADESALAFDKLLLELCGRNLKDLAQDLAARKRSRTAAEDYDALDRARLHAKRGIASSMYTPDSLSSRARSFAELVISPNDLQTCISTLLPFFKNPIQTWIQTATSASMFQVVVDKKDKLDETMADAFVEALDCPLKPSMSFNWRHWANALGDDYNWDEFFDANGGFRPTPTAMRLLPSNWSGSVSPISMTFSRFHLGRTGDGVSTRSYVLGATRLTGSSVPLGVPGTEALGGGPETRIQYSAMSVLANEIKHVSALAENDNTFYATEEERPFWQRAVLDGPVRACYANDAPAAPSVQLAYQRLCGWREDGRRAADVSLPRHPSHFDGSLSNFLAVILHDLDHGAGISGTHVHFLRLFLCARPFRAHEEETQRAISLSQHGTPGDGKTFLIRAYTNWTAAEQCMALTRITNAFEDGVRRGCTDANSMRVYTLDEGPHGEMARPDAFGRDNAEQITNRSRWKERLDEGTGASASALKASANNNGQGVGEERTASKRDATYVVTSNHPRRDLDQAFLRRFVFSYVVPAPRADGASQSELDQSRDTKYAHATNLFWSDSVGRLALVYDDLAATSILHRPNTAALDVMWRVFCKFICRFVGHPLPYANQHIHGVRRTAHQIAVLRAAAVAITNLPPGKTSTRIATRELFLDMEARVAVERELLLFTCGLVIKDTLFWPPTCFACAYAVDQGELRNGRYHCPATGRGVTGSQTQREETAAGILAAGVQAWLGSRENQARVRAVFDKPHSIDQLKHAVIEVFRESATVVRDAHAQWNPESGEWLGGKCPAIRLESEEDGRTWLSFEEAWCNAMANSEATFYSIHNETANELGGLTGVPIAAFPPEGAGAMLQTVG